MDVTDREVYAAVALMDGATVNEAAMRLGAGTEKVRRAVNRLLATGYLVRDRSRGLVIGKFLAEDEEPVSPDDYPTVVVQVGRIPPEIANRPRWQI